MFDFNDNPFSKDMLEPGCRKRVRLLLYRETVFFPSVIGQCCFHDPDDSAALEETIRHDACVAVVSGKVERSGFPDSEKSFTLWNGIPAGTVVCLCRVLAVEPHQDGGCSALMVGLRRVKIASFFSNDSSFCGTNAGTWIDAELCEEPYSREELPEYDALRSRLLGELARFLDEKGVEKTEQFETFLPDTIPLGVLSDVVASMIEFDMAEKRSLLAETAVTRRVDRLLEGLARLQSDLFHERLRSMFAMAELAVN